MSIPYPAVVHASSKPFFSLHMSESLQNYMHDWKVILRENSFASSERSANAVARFLVMNDFYSISDLEGARHPSAWAGAGDIFESKFE